MKKLALIYNSEFDIYEKFSDYFKHNKDVSISVFYYNKSEKLNSLKSDNIELKSINEFDEVLFDLIIFSDYKSIDKCDVEFGEKSINIHPSLLPAFDCSDALSAVYNSGVKVGGVSVHYILQNNEKYKIIAQYPLLISNVMHFDEYVENMLELSGFLYPRVVEKLLDNKIFDFEDLLKSCNHGCGNCSGCGAHN